MCQTHDLKKMYPEQYRMLEKLFGIEKVRSKAIRLNDIYTQCEKEWKKNLDRLGNNPVKYLLIAEAPPWSENDPISYFYKTFTGTLCSSVWYAFFDKKSKDVNDALTRLAKKGFLLIDSLPFPMKYETSHRKEQSYKDIIKSYKIFLDAELQKIKWAKEVKLALAYPYNGKAIIKALSKKYELPKGQKIKLCEFLIAADGSNNPNSKILKDIWSLD